MTTDLFWVPAVGDKVKFRQSAMWRRGGTAGADGAHTVISDAGTVENSGQAYRMFWLTADGPVTYRTDKKGRRHEIKPTSSTPACLDEIEPFLESK